jgi:hypothetical protein
MLRIWRLGAAAEMVEKLDELSLIRIPTSLDIQCIYCFSNQSSVNGGKLLNLIQG